MRRILSLLVQWQPERGEEITHMCLYECCQDKCRDVERMLQQMDGKIARSGALPDRSLYGGG